MKVARRTRMAMARAAILTLTGEIIDELKGTSLYKQRDKNLINKVAELIYDAEVQHAKDGFYDNGAIEEQFRTMQTIIESFKDALAEGPIENLHLLIAGHRNFIEGKFVDNDNDEKIDLHTKSIVAPEVKRAIKAMQVKGYSDNAITSYLFELVENEQQQKSA